MLKRFSANQTMRISNNRATSPSSSESPPRRRPYGRCGMAASFQIDDNDESVGPNKIQPSKSWLNLSTILKDLQLSLGFGLLYYCYDGTCRNLHAITLARRRRFEIWCYVSWCLYYNRQGLWGAGDHVFDECSRPSFYDASKRGSLSFTNYNVELLLDFHQNAAKKILGNRVL